MGAAAPVTSGTRSAGSPAGAPATPNRLHSLCRAGPVDSGSIRSGVELNRPGLLLRHFLPQTARRVRDGESPAPLRPGSRLPAAEQSWELPSPPAPPRAAGSPLSGQVPAPPPDPVRPAPPLPLSAGLPPAAPRRAPSRQLPMGKTARAQNVPFCGTAPARTALGAPAPPARRRGGQAQARRARRSPAEALPSPRSARSRGRPLPPRTAAPCGNYSVHH